MFDLPKPILKQLLSVKNTHPERLSHSELTIADRIVHCALCDNFWVRRKQKIPERCPACHRRDWDRPLITAMLLAQKAAEETAHSLEDK